MTSEQQPGVRAVDVAIIGAGTAGLNAWKAATAEGASALMIDPGPLGTTCARVGCMPSKLLIAAADAAHGAERAELFGVQAGPVTVDPVAVMDRVRSMRDLFVRKTVSRGPGRAREAGALLDGRARIVAPGVLEVGEQRLEARSIVLATGSRPWTPPPWRGLGDRVLTNDDVFELERLPGSVLVIGAGAIGLELGQAFGRLGVRVAVLDVAGRLGALDDPEVHDVALTLFRKDLEIHLRHELKHVKLVDDGVLVRFVGEDGVEREAVWERILVAAGRRANLDGLGLVTIGLDPLPEPDPRTGRLGESNVFVAGDVSGSRMLLHEAAHEGRIAGSNAARFPEVTSHERKTPLALVFSDPQIALVGLRHGDLDPEAHAVGGLDFAFQSRAKVLGRDAGRLHVYAEVVTGKLVGAAIVGPAAEHLAHLLAWAVEAGMTVAQAVDMPFYHPVLEEGLEGALKDLAGKIQRRRAA
jgi:dihydrolipoamide dehydrogenase